MNQLSLSLVAIHGLFSGRHLSVRFALIALVAGLCLQTAQAQDMELNPTFGSVNLKADFRPDPFVKNLTAGGPIQTNLGGVKAYIANAPDFKLYYEAGKYPLTIHVESSADTTLLINLPNGSWIANDDGPNTGLNPLLYFANPQSGRYDIWVGTYGKDLAPATLKITEMTNTVGTPPKDEKKLVREEVVRQWQRALDLSKQQKYVEAAAIYEKILPPVEDIYGKDGTDTAGLVNNLADLYRNMNKYAKAEPLYQRSLHIREAKLGRDDLKVSYTLGSLGFVCWKMNDYAKAEPLYQRSLHIREAKLNGDHADVFVAVDNLALLYRDMGRHAQAEPLYQRCLRIRENQFGYDHTNVVDALNNLAYLYSTMSQYARAEPLYQRSLRIREAKLGNDHPSVAETLNSLAYLYRSMAHYAKAEPLYERSLRIREAKLGNDHPDVALTLNSLATLYSAMGQHARAEPLLQRSLQIREAKLGNDHPDVASSLNDLGNLYRSMDQYAKAEPLYQRSLQIRETKLGKESLSVAASLNNLAYLYSSMGQFAQVEALHQRSLHIRETKLGKDHPDVAQSLSNLGNLYRGMGQFTKAESFYQRSLRIREARLGKDHPDVASSLNDLANLYFNLDRYEQAETHYLRSLQIWEDKLGKDHFTVATALSNLANMYCAMGQHAKAEPLCQRSLQIREAALGKTHHRVATTLQSQANIAWAKKEPEQAVALLEQAVEIYSARLGKNHPTTNQAMSKLAIYLSQTRQPAEALRTMDQSLRGLRLHTAQVLPMLPESEQLSFMVNTFEGHFLSAISLGLQPDLSEENRLRTAGWLLNGKSIMHQSLVERLLLARDSQSSNAKRLLVELEKVRRQIARLNRESADPADDAQYRKTIEALREKEKSLETQLNPAGLARRSDPWIEIDELRRKLPASAVYVDFLRFAPTDCITVSRKRLKRETIYVALITTRNEETTIVNLGSADKIDAAIVASRQQLQQAHDLIRREGELEAEKQLQEKMVAVSKLILEPLLPRLNRYPQWILGPDGNLWLVPWACLPLDDQQYVIEKHTLRYVTSGRDLVLNPLQLDQKASAPAIFADPDFDLDPSKLFTATSNLRGESGLRDVLSGNQLAGKIEDWQVKFEFQTTGKLLVRDKATRNKVGEGTWKLQAGRLVMQTEVSHYEGSEQGNQIAGQRTKRNANGTTSQDRWQIVLPAEETWTRHTDFRALRSFGKVSRLPGTAAEADAITPALAKLTRIPPRRFLEGEATVGAFQTLKGPRVLVLSTHGFFLPQQEIPEHVHNRAGDVDVPAAIPGLENPLLHCGLLLAGCNKRLDAKPGENDGILTGLEIVGTDLRGTELVVLSACETGLGDIRNGEGVAGLREAFHLAGAQAVVASLWKIPDRETSLLMKRYFENMSAGQNKVDALRDAQLTMLRDRRTRNGAAHPFYWAAFTLTGR